MRDGGACVIRRTVEYGGQAYGGRGVFHSPNGCYPHAPMPVRAEARPRRCPAAPMPGRDEARPRRCPAALRRLPRQTEEASRSDAVVAYSSRHTRSHDMRIDLVILVISRWIGKVGKGNSAILCTHGRLAQRLAQVLYTHKAGGSNPSSPTMNRRRGGGFALAFFVYDGEDRHAPRERLP